MADAENYSASTDEFTAFVQIGDRTFGKKGKYPFVYDLAEEWRKLTGLPFTFAAWIANKHVPADFVKELNASLKYGLDHREELFKGLHMRNDFDIKDYLTNKISYPLTNEKKKALHLFHNFIKALE